MFNKLIPTSMATPHMNTSNKAKIDKFLHFYIFKHRRHYTQRRLAVDKNNYAQCCDWRPRKELTLYFYRDSHNKLHGLQLVQGESKLKSNMAPLN